MHGAQIKYSKTSIYRASRGKRKKPGKSRDTVNRGTVNRGTVNRGTVNRGMVNRGTVNRGLTVITIPKYPYKSAP